MATPFIVKDINPTTKDSYPQGLTNVNGTLYFTANNGNDREQLWMSDSTAGTVPVKDIGYITYYTQDLININSTLYFTANDDISGTELWKSDGTAAGTVLVKDIYDGIIDAYPGRTHLKNG